MLLKMTFAKGAALPDLQASSTPASKATSKGAVSCLFGEAEVFLELLCEWSEDVFGAAAFVALRRHPCSQPPTMKRADAAPSVSRSNGSIGDPP